MCQKFMWWWKEIKELKIQKQSTDNVTNNIRNYFGLKKENEPIKDSIIRLISLIISERF